MTGRSALVILTLTLSITPMRRWLTLFSKYSNRHFGKRLSDWNWLVRLRRMLGLWCFVYAFMHVWVYAAFDIGYDWSAAWTEVKGKPYILAGLLAFVMLLPLALTSTQSMVRMLGRNWRRLHRLSYAIALIALLHFWWLTKPGLWSPWPDTIAILLLLGYRATLYSGLLDAWDGFDGRESMVRDNTHIDRNING